MVRGVRKGGVGGNLRGGRNVSYVARCRATIFLRTLLAHPFAIGRPFPLCLFINDFDRLTRSKRGCCPTYQVRIDAGANEVRYDRGHIAHFTTSISMPLKARISLRLSLKTSVSTPFTSMTRKRSSL